MKKKRAVAPGKSPIPQTPSNDFWALLQPSPQATHGGDRDSHEDEGLFQIIDELPPLLSRKRAEDLLGGAVTAKGLANADSSGYGPPRYRINNRIVYVTSELIAWIAAKSKRLK